MLILMQEEKVVEEILTLKIKEPNVAQVVADDTTMISLVEACVQNAELCGKLSPGTSGD